MSGSSYWPMSAVYVHGTAPLSRIHATATEVSRPPEKAMPTRSPAGREVRTLDMEIVCIVAHDHAKSVSSSAPTASMSSPGVVRLSAGVRAVSPSPAVRLRDQPERVPRPPRLRRPAAVTGRLPRLGGGPFGFGFGVDVGVGDHRAQHLEGGHVVLVADVLVDHAPQFGGQLAQPQPGGL